MSLHKLAKIVGYLFIIIGVLGYIPVLTDENNLLLGIFYVNGAHNLLHILTGLIAIGNYERENAFSNSDLALLTTLANE